MGYPKALTRDQLAKFLPDQEAIRRFEELFLIAGTTTPDQIIILFRLSQEIAIEAATAQETANEAIASIERLLERAGLLPVTPPFEQTAANDDLAPPIQTGTLAYQNAEEVEVGNLAVTGNLTVTGTGGNVSWGRYTPTLTNVSNLDASTAYLCQYMRVGNTVTVSGLVDADPTAPAAQTQLGISLPVASNIGAVEDCAGAAASNTMAGQSAAILGDVANNRAQMEWISSDVTNQPMYFNFTYQVI